MQSYSLFSLALPSRNIMVPGPLHASVVGSLFALLLTLIMTYPIPPLDCEALNKILSVSSLVPK